MNCIDMVGFKSGALTVIEYAGSGLAGPRSGAFWRCRCDCGGECIRRGVALRNGKTISCGCYRKVWSPELRSALLDRHFNGSSTEQIAQEFGVTPAAVRAARLRAGVKPGRHSNPWTPEQDRQLVEGVAANKSAGLIADEMGRTRNMIIGRANRLGIRFGKPKHTRPPRLAARRVARSQRAVVQFIRKKTPLETLNASIPVEQRKTLLELEPNSCRWPVGNVGKPGFFFCGAVKSDPFPYCEAHCGHAYVLGKRELAA